MDLERLQAVLESHRKWLKGEEGGNRADLSDADLSGAVLSGAVLRRAVLSDADLRRADLSDADLSGAVLSGADLRRADLSDAVLSDAVLSGAVLSDAVLSGADLRRADLSGADLDFGVWPLWCGSVGVKVDNRIALQLMYHACAVDYEDCSEHIKQALDELKSTAKRFLEYRDDAPKLKKSK